MAWLSLSAGLVLAAVDYAPHSSSTLRRNIAKRLLMIARGTLGILSFAPAHLTLNWACVGVGILLGGCCLDLNGFGFLTLVGRRNVF